MGSTPCVSTEKALVALRDDRGMSLPNVDSDARDAATLILPGAVGIGVGVFVATLLSDSLAVLIAAALAGAVVGHAAGYLAVRARSDRFG